MTNKLDEKEIELRQSIKRIAGILNDVSKNFRKFKESLLRNKQALKVLAQNFQSGKIDANRFRSVVKEKIIEIVKKVDRLRDDFTTLGRRIDAAKRILQAEHQLDPQNPDQLTTWLAINLKTAEGHLQDFLERIAMLEKMLFAGEASIISHPENSQQLEELIDSTLDNTYNMFEIIERGTKREMQAILKVYTIHFKMYRSSRGACLGCGQEIPRDVNFCPHCGKKR
jgi:DNA repair exonuclease SbcCD ATPase subunit|tara:strand:- start:230 stop:907 length:678 start_codon:yes stop_codon:yes gene_type:complete